MRRTRAQRQRRSGAICGFRPAGDPRHGCGFSGTTRRHSRRPRLGRREPARGFLGVERGGVPPVARGRGRGVSGRSGASVSRFPPKSGSCPNTVALGSTSTRLPHFEQKRAVSGNCCPQLVQYMGPRILPSPAFPSEPSHARYARLGRHFRQSSDVWASAGPSECPNLRRAPAA